VTGGDAMANPDIDQLLQRALIGSRPAIMAYLNAVADPRIVAKFELVNFSLLQQVESLAHKKRLREVGIPMNESSKRPRACLALIREPAQGRE
jgi:hypothetical protein